MRSITLNGIVPFPVTVTATVAHDDASARLSVIGYSDSVAARETMPRVRAALRAVDLSVSRRTDVVIAPEGPPSAPVSLSPAFDLPIALAVAKAYGREVSAGAVCSVGELDLIGRIRPVRGCFPMVEYARTAGESVVVPSANQHEAAAVTGANVAVAETLADVLSGRLDAVAPVAATAAALPADPLADVRVAPSVREAFRAAVLEGRPILLIAPPGAGATMLARRAAWLLPTWGAATRAESLAVWSVAGLLTDHPLPAGRPFRAPHHTVSERGLLGAGGGAGARPGEASLAHGGVLFLDEASEFENRLLVEVCDVHRRRRVATAAADWPADFRLIAAMHPCPCGWHGTSVRPCDCTTAQIARYQSRVLPHFRNGVVLDLSPTPAAADAPRTEAL